MNRKYDNQWVAEIIAEEGIGHAVQDYLSAESIRDDQLREAWKRAKAALDEIDAILKEFRE